LATLPMRLKDWKLGPDGRMFAYGGDEVEVSLWDAEHAFSADTSTNGEKKAEPRAKEGKKRKRGDDLLPGEVWRAKNVANDELSLRVPVRNTSLAFLTPGGDTKNTDNGAHILAGTHIGAVRRYDTRAARKPVASWKGIVKTGPVKGVQRGYHE
jgi:ribosome biogenesis protein NSA1